MLKAWYIGFEDAKKLNQQTIGQLLTLSRPEDIQLSQKDQTVFLTKLGMSLDLGTLAKGCIADFILADLKANSATAALLDFGGNILTYGQPVQIGIQHPFAPRGQTLGTVSSHNQALVTSGTYERFFRTTAELTTIFWTSKLFGLDSRTILTLIKQDPMLEGLLLTHHKKRWLTTGLTKRFKPLYH